MVFKGSRLILLTSVLTACGARSASPPAAPPPSPSPTQSAPSPLAQAATPSNGTRAPFAPSACDQGASPVIEPDPSFGTLAELRDFVSASNLLGRSTPNPICDLREILRKGSESASKSGPLLTALIIHARTTCSRDPRACALARSFDEYQAAVHQIGSVGPMSSLMIESDWENIDIRAGNLSEELTFTDQPDGPTQLRDLLFAGIALEVAMTRNTQWVDPALGDLAPRASAEFNIGYPSLGLESYLTAFSCYDKSDQFTLNYCQLRRDVAGLALAEAFKRLNIRRRDDLELVSKLQHTSNRPAYHRLKIIEDMAKTRDALIEFARQGDSLQTLLNSTSGRQLSEQAETLLDMHYDVPSREVFRAVVELQGFNRLAIEMSRFKAANKDFADSQFRFWQGSLEMKEVTELLSEHMQRIVDRVQDYIDAQSLLRKARGR